MSNEVFHPMADNQQGVLLQCVSFLLRKPENSSSLEGVGILLKSCLQSQVPVPPFTSPAESDAGGGQEGCPTHTTLGSASAATIIWGKCYWRLKKLLISSFLLSCWDKPDTTDECCSQPGMKSTWWEQLSSLIFEHWCFPSNYSSHPSSARHVP